MRNKTALTLLLASIMGGFALSGQVLANDTENQAMSVENPATTISSQIQKNVGLEEKEISKLYPEGTVILAHVLLEKDSIEKMDQLVRLFVEKKLETENETRTMNDIESFNKAVLFVKGLTNWFGPDLTIGAFNLSEEKNDIDFILATSLRSKYIYPEDVIAEFGQGLEYKKTRYNYDTIYTAYKNDKEHLAMSFYKNYMIISQHSDSVKAALDNVRKDKASVFTAPMPKKVFKNLENDYIASVFFDNTSIVKFVYDKELEKKLSSKEEFLKKYFEILLNADSYTALSFDYKDKQIVFDAYSPADWDVLDLIGPDLKKEAKDLYNVTQGYPVAMTLPNTTAGYVKLTNLAELADFIKLYPDKEVQRTVYEGQQLIKMMTNLDLYNNIIPMFSGHTTIAAVDSDGKAEPVVLVSYSEKNMDSLKTFTTYISQKDPEIKVEEETSSCYSLRTIYAPEFTEYAISYTKINDSIIFGKKETLKQLLSLQAENNGILANTPVFAPYTNYINDKLIMSLFVDVQKAVILAETTTDRCAPKKFNVLLDSLESMFFFLKPKEENIYQVKSLINIK